MGGTLIYFLIKNQNRARSALFPGHTLGDMQPDYSTPVFIFWIGTRETSCSGLWDATQGSNGCLAPTLYALVDSHSLERSSSQS